MKTACAWGERLPVRLSSRKLTRGLPMILRSATGLLPKMNSHQRTIESILRGFEDRAPCGYFLLQLIKIGAKVVSHGRHVAFQMAEVAIPRALFAEILQRITALRSRPAPTPT